MGRSFPTQQNSKIVRLIATALLVMGVWTWFPSHALAHADLIRGEPSLGERIATPPTELLLQYSERIQSASIRVIDSVGERIDTGTVHINPDDPKLIQVPLEDMGTGIYTVQWKVLSIDGHSTSGAYYFSVGEPISREELLAGFEDRTKTVHGKAGNIDVTLSLTPVEVGVNVFEVFLRRDGKPVEADEVHMLTYQSEAGVYLPKYRLDSIKPSLYATVGAFTVPGSWAFQVTFRVEDTLEAVRFDVEVPSVKQDRVTQP